MSKGVDVALNDVVQFFLVFIEGHHIFGSIFGIVGIIALLASFYTVSNSLRVNSDSVHLNTVRRVFGIPVKRKKLRLDGHIRFSKDSNFQSQSGGNHVMHYSIYATDNSGQKACVGRFCVFAAAAFAGPRVLVNDR